MRITTRRHEHEVHVTVIGPLTWSNVCDLLDHLDTLCATPTVHEIHLGLDAATTVDATARRRLDAALAYIRRSDITLLVGSPSAA